MSVWNPFRNRLRPLASRTRRTRTARPALEYLEDRCVPTTLYVNVNGGSDANPGTAAAPFASIQAAVNVAKQFAIGQRAPQQDNNTIVVAVGTYTSSTQPNDANSLGFLSVVGVVDQQLTISGGWNAAFTAQVGQSVIDGGGQVRGVAVVASARDTAVALDGFVIQNGFGGPQTNGGTLTAFGGGMLINMGARQTNPTDTLRNVTFRGNNVQGAGNTSSTFNNGAGGEGVGGGLAALFANNVVLTNVAFDTNSARGGNGPIRGGSGLGGALYGAEGSHITGQSVTFTNNQVVGGNSSSVGTESGKFAEGFGGAVALLGFSGTQGASATSLSLTTVTATGNVAQGGNSGNGAAGDARGGAFYSENANVTLTDATLSGNKANAGTATNGGQASAGGGAYATAFNTNVVVTLNRVSVLNNQVNSANVAGTPTQGLGGGLGFDTANGISLIANITNTVIAGNAVNAAGTVIVNSGGGALWSDHAAVNLLHDTLADNTIAATNMTGSAILIFSGTDNLAFDIIANELSGQPAVASVQGGAVNLTGLVLFSNVSSFGVGSQANLLAADAKFTNAAGRDYTLQQGSAAINAATGSTLKVDRLNFRRVGVPDLGAFEFGGLPPSAFAAKLGAYRPSDGSWSLDSDGTFGFGPNDQVFFHFSPGGVTGVAGDWTGAGFANIGDFSNGVWHLDLNGNGRVDAGETFTFGQAGDKPVVGDWTGDGITKIGVFRAAPDGITGEFILDVANHKTMDGSNLVFTFGFRTDRIVVGDWTGDGVAKVGVFRDATAFGAPGAAVFSLDINNNHTFDAGDQVFIFGLITDGLVIGDWNGDGVSKVGVYRDGANGFNALGTALFSLDTNGNRQYDPGIDSVFLFGLTSDQFVAGNWKPTPPLQPAQFAADGFGPGGVPALTDAELASVLNQAIAYWAARGADASLLASVPARVGTLGDGLVGWTDASGITLDATAAGWGWFVDPTPDQSEEFTQPGPDGLHATADSPAFGKMDLLTVLEHEFGHELGLDDVDPAASPSDMMAATLATGVRRL
jgi:hypothetical protein